MELNFIDDLFVGVLVCMASEETKEHKGVVVAMKGHGCYTKKLFKSNPYFKIYESPPPKHSIIKLRQLEFKLLPLYRICLLRLAQYFANQFCK